MLLSRLPVSLITTLVACSPAKAPPASSPSSEAAGATVPAGSAPETPSGTSPAPSKTGPVGAICGGIAGFGCEAGAYCSFPPEAQCGAADQSGTCARVPDVCTQELAPVCGCDDKTYPNACQAARAGVSVLKKGECA